jgi:hypothetical protein
MQTISAIDVGSNAIRMPVGSLSVEQDQIQVIEIIPIPVPLGQDVFRKATFGNSVWWQKTISYWNDKRWQSANRCLEKPLKHAWKFWNEL